jgi:hypothetical protein
MPDREAVHCPSGDHSEIKVKGKGETVMKKTREFRTVKFKPGERGFQGIGLYIGKALVGTLVYHGRMGLSVRINKRVKSLTMSGG